MDSKGNSEATGTVILDGGKAGQTYTVTTKLVAKTVDASAQASDLRLTVGNLNDGTGVDQTIKLGTGNDILTFNDLDSLNAKDTITDAGGVDTLRAAFSKNVDGALNLADIEALHIVATENVTLDLAKAHKYHRVGHSVR